MKNLKLIVLCLALLPTVLLTAQKNKSCSSTCSDSYGKNTAFKEKFSETITKTVSFASNSNDNLFVIENINGNIAVEGYNGKSVKVKAVKKIKARNSQDLELGKREVNVGMFQSDQVIYFYLDSPYSEFNSNDGTFSFINGRSRTTNQYNFEIEYTVLVPSNTNVRLNNVSGSEVTVSGLNTKEVELGNVSGHLEARNIKSRNLIMNTVSGHIDADDIQTNAIEAITVSGHVDLNDITGETKAKTVSGNVKVVYAENPIGDNSYTSTSGNVNIGLQSNLDAHIKCKVTLSGNIISDYNEISKSKTGPDKWSGLRSQAEAKIGRGGSELYLETGSGNIYLQRI